MAAGGRQSPAQSSQPQHMPSTCSAHALYLLLMLAAAFLVLPPNRHLAESLTYKLGMVKQPTCTPWVSSTNPDVS